MSSSTAEVVYALDFDGVLCDSVEESSQTALRAAETLWPHLQTPRPDSSHLLKAMREIRPVIETGFENVLLARLAIEASPYAIDDQFVRPVLKDWPSIRDSVMAEWGVSKERLVEVFGQTRDKWIATDVASWISSNRMFPGVVDALNFANAPVYIITTKQTRFCLLLLKEHGVSNISEGNVYGFGTGSKASILKQLLKSPDVKGKTLCFVEDRYETLEAVSLSMLGQPLELFLASWGYNTQQTRATAEKHPFINLIDLPTFVNRMQ